MSRLYVFADEAGDFEFNRGHNISRYFLLCTVTMQSCAVGNALLDLRRKLAWEKKPIDDYFHATSDRQIIRDAVFAEICKHEFRIDATLLEKSKAFPSARVTRARFYQFAWYYHFKHVAPRIVNPAHELLTTTAALGTKKERLSFHSAVQDVMRQTVPAATWAMNFCPCAADPCLQVADYCAWAIQKKWEKGNVLSYNLIKDRIASEFDLWQVGTVHHY